MTDIILVLLVLAAIFLGPFALIWSLNTLFGLGILTGFKTWLAAFFFLSVFAGNFK